MHLMVLYLLKQASLNLFLNIFMLFSMLGDRLFQITGRVSNIVCLVLWLGIIFSKMFFFLFFPHETLDRYRNSSV